SVAVGWKMYDLTQDTFYLGLIGLMQFLPMLVLMLPAGHVIDQYDRKRIIRLCQMIEMVGILLLAAGSFAGGLTKESLLTLVFLIGAARTFEGPALQALLPGIVQKETFPQALALSTSSFQTAVIVGPAFGGFLYTLGSEVVFAVVGGLYLLSNIFIMLIKAKPAVAKREPVSLQSMMAGISFIRSKPIILGAISLDLFAVLLGGATALLPVYAKEILLVGPVGLGILRSAPAVGSLFMSLVLAHRPLRNEVGKTMFIAVGIFGLATIIFAMAESFWLSIGALVVLGAADTISMVVRGSLVQLQTPDAMRGRVSSVNSLFIGTSNQLGEFESGITASWLGVVPSVVLGGVGTVAVALIWMRIFPSLRNMKSFEAA
ncbi:MAG: arabinose efflux permease family protein, partial [Firmicutes bacterium]|nr:arabinose efflux permease family protein [Bacillota bacterium]